MKESARYCFLAISRRGALFKGRLDNFDIVNFDKSADRFDIYLDEKRVQLREDKNNLEVISYCFGAYHVIQDYPLCGRSAYLYVRKRKWFDSHPMRSSVTIGIYWNLRRHGSTKSLCFFLKKEIDSTPASICALVERYGVKGQLLRKQYKKNTLLYIIFWVSGFFTSLYVLECL